MVQKFLPYCSRAFSFWVGQMGTEKLLDVSAVAVALGCGRRHVYRLVAERRLRALKVDRRGTLRFRTAWVLEFIDGSASAPGPGVACAIW